MAIIKLIIKITILTVITLVAMTMIKNSNKKIKSIRKLGN